MLAFARLAFAWPAEGGGIGLRAGRPPTVTGTRKERATGRARDGECRVQAAAVSTAPVRSEPGRMDRVSCPSTKCAVMGPGLPEPSARHQHLISTSGGVFGTGGGPVGGRGLSQACQAIGDVSQARDHRREALARYPELGAPEADELRAQLTTAGPWARGW
jgi:hypothetical protein